MYYLTTTYAGEQRHYIIEITPEMKIRTPLPLVGNIEDASSFPTQERAARWLKKLRRVYPDLDAWITEDDPVTGALHRIAN